MRRKAFLIFIMLISVFLLNINITKANPDRIVENLEGASIRLKTESTKQAIKYSTQDGKKSLIQNLIH